MEPEPESFAERNPVRRAGGAALGTLRQRLDARGRLEEFERRLADRRRARFANPQLETDDTYRAYQRLNSQRVINHNFGISDPPSMLTGFLHHNPSLEAMGGQIGRMIARPARPIARERDADDRFIIVDTDAEIQKSIEGRDLPDVD
tara:strand:+ start:227 stop:667 length:441 start_codon:yes stop_codon:yes gene_type:complete